MASRRVILRPGGDGWWTVECPSLPGCVSQGRSRVEALANIREAIDLYIDVLREDGETVPGDDYGDAELAAA